MPSAPNESERESKKPGMNRAFCWLAFWRRRIGQSVSEHAAHHAAHHAADEGCTGIAATTAAAAATTAGAVAFTMGRLVVGVIARGSWGSRDDFRQQRLVLQLVEEAGLGIAPGGLPAREHRARRVIELACHLDVETKTVKTALHVAVLALVETDLVFRGVVGIVGKGGGIDAGGQIAGRGRGTVLQRGDPGQRQRL